MYQFQSCVQCSEDYCAGCFAAFHLKGNLKKHRSVPITVSETFDNHMGKPTICLCENKGADQLRGNREADQRLCFRYSDSTILLLLESEISSFQLFTVLVQAGLCRTCSKTTLLVFPRGGSYDNHICFHTLTVFTKVCLAA